MDTQPDSQPKHPVDGWGNLIWPVRDIGNCSRPSADERIRGLDEKLPVREIKPLTRFVEYQQARLLDQRPSQQHHPLETGG